MRNVLASAALVLGLLSLGVIAVAQNQPATFDLASLKATSPKDKLDLGPRAALVGGCISGGVEISHARFVVRKTTLYDLIALGYGLNCLTVNAQNLLLGGPDWLRSDQFDIEALEPGGSPAYTLRQLQNGEAPSLQTMIQALLTDRFKLAIHRETRELPVYVLTIAKSGPKLQPHKNGSCVDPESARGASGPRPEVGTKVCGDMGIRLNGANLVYQTTGVSLAEFSRMLSAVVLDRQVIDRTGIDGLFDTTVEFSPDGTRFATTGAARADSSAPSIFSSMEEQLGLKLDSGNGPVDILVIDHVEKPSEN